MNSTTMTSMIRHLLKIVSLLLFLVAFNASAITIEAYLGQVSAEQKLTLIDVRTPALFSQGHIPNAINIPSQAIAGKRLPPLGNVVVYGDGIDQAIVQKAVELLNTKPGIDAKILDGGFAAWLSSQSVVQEKHGIELSGLHHLTFHKLEKIAATDPALVLVDIRTKKDATPIASVFGDVRTISADISEKGEAGVISMILSYSSSKNKNLFVLIDDGDDSAVRIVNQLHAASMKRVAVLMGGEIAMLARGEMSEVVQVFGKR